MIILKNKIEMISEENAFVHVSGHPNRRRFERYVQVGE